MINAINAVSNYSTQGGKQFSTEQYEKYCKRAEIVHRHSPAQRGQVTLYNDKGNEWKYQSKQYWGAS